MPRIFEQIIDDIIKTEGGYVDHPADRGGPTNFGITQAVAREVGNYHGPMQQMPRNVAVEIYRTRYITGPGFDVIYEISSTIGTELIDTGVNMGPAVAGIFLQRWLNVFGVAAGDLFIDGRCGPLTRAALRAFIDKRGSEGIKVLYRALNGVQANRYLELAERDKSQRAFIYGWIKNRVQA